ncbi:flavin monoamine oxidase family protein [Paraliomyxa miuraensis]|uniref:hypothetical protein n=1 Tax=Paraliomyxa miuraensis TaxID=376150 RepID=UPI0022551D52|nr:hypothetical protein [Paraliomyxa miuraensis]MCX4240466.1 hypothetical protein [Paraliomyxa miuraensis]
MTDKNKHYSIFGAGAAGLYTAWRLLNGKLDPNKKGLASKQLRRGDVLELYDWGRYDFVKGSKLYSGTRSAGARVCTWFYQNDPQSSYVELGGMRYSYWNSKAKDANGGLAPGHRVVTKVISMLGLDELSVPFNVTNDQLFYLRSRNFYLNEISSNDPAPYAASGFGASTTPDQGFSIVENLAVSGPMTRKQWCEFYATGTITARLPDTCVFQQGDRLEDIGYWNLLYDQLGSEGYEYAADGNGYSSNVINTHAGVSFNINNEFTPGTQYRTLSIGYSGMFSKLFDAILALAKKKGITFRYHPDTRLHSILWKGGKAAFTYASRKHPNHAAGHGEADAAWLAMPPAAIDLVAQATRYQRHPKATDVLNEERVSLYLESAILQPSYKIGMFFDHAWWAPDAENPAPYPAKITGYEVTPHVIAALATKKFPPKVLHAMASETVDYVPFETLEALVAAIEAITETPLTIAQTKQLGAAARRDTIGPSVTNSPIRMVVYFGNNARDQDPKRKKVYGILASYDDEDNTAFWRELELGPKKQREKPVSQDLQPLEGPRAVPERMTKMLRRMLAELHYGPNSSYTAVPKPLEAAYMDWSLPPFNAGYHEWAPHFDIGDVQRKIRKPSQLVPKVDAEIFIVGEAFSNDQAWVEGAYCTAESVLNDFFGIVPIIDDKEYPFICPER